MALITTLTAVPDSSSVTGWNPPRLPGFAIVQTRKDASIAPSIAVAAT